MSDLTNKVVLITGGSSGIGKSLAEKFGEEGTKIIITGRDDNKLSETVKELADKKINIISFKSDVSNEEEVKQLVELTIEKFGKIDVLINNAGISHRSMFEDMDLKVFQKVMDINFFGNIYTTKYFLPHLLKSNGSIIVISSISGLRGIPSRSAYSASKFALQGFYESLRVELLYRKVNILMVYPGYTKSSIRENALNATGEKQKETSLDEEKTMSSEKVAKKIYVAWKNKKRTLVLSSLGKSTVLLNKFFPSSLDNLTYKHIKNEKNSLLADR